MYIHHGGIVPIGHYRIEQGVLFATRFVSRNLMSAVFIVTQEAVCMQEERLMGERERERERPA